MCFALGISETFYPFVSAAHSHGSSLPLMLRVRCQKVFHPGRPGNNLPATHIIWYDEIVLIMTIVNGSITLSANCQLLLY